MSEPSWWPTSGTEPDARVTMANERTLLAYNRTALGFLLGGLAVSGSRSVGQAPAWFAATGLPLIGLAGYLALAGRARYLAVQRAVRAGEPLPAPRPAVRSAMTLAVVAGLAVVAAALQL